MKMRMLFTAILFSLCALSNISTAQSGEANLDSYIESLRADVRADKVAIITAAMQFNDQRADVLASLPEIRSRSHEAQ